MRRIRPEMIKDLEKALVLFNRHSDEHDYPLKKIAKKILGAKPESKFTLADLYALLDNPQHKFFVYGTLMPHQANHHLVEKIEGQWFTAYTFGEKTEVSYGSAKYEGLVYDGGKEMIFGYMLKSEHMTTLWEFFDEFEGEKYQRSLIPLWVNGEFTVATTYTVKVEN